MNLRGMIEFRPCEHVPSRQQRHRFRAQIGEDQFAGALHGIRIDRYPIAPRRVIGSYAVLERYLDAFAFRIEQPSVIGTTQSPRVGNAVFEIGTAMRAPLADETEFTRFRTVERQ